MEYVSLSIVESVLNWEWSKAAAFLGFWIAAFTLLGILGARIPKFGHWIGSGVQNVLGIADIARGLSTLGDQFNEYVRRNDKDGQARDAAIERLAATVNTFVEKVPPRDY